VGAPRRSVASLLAVLLAAGCDDPDLAEPDAAPPSDGGSLRYTIVVLPDTQFYADTYHDIFKAQVDWILAQRSNRRIAFVLHEGDIVNFDVPDQWKVASAQLHRLDGVVPYALAVGNHDLTWRGVRLTRDAELMNQSFPAADLAASPWPTGTFESDRMQNTYQVFDAFGWRWLVLSLEFGPRDAVVDWADGILQRYSMLPAIVVTHAYVYSDGRTTARYSATTRQPFWACGYPGLKELGGCNDGQELWDKLISRHDNVVFVFSGHVLHPAWARLASDHPSGRQTQEVLANYQTCGDIPCRIPETGQPTRGGDGFLRLVTLDPAERTATVETISPYPDLANPIRHPDPANHFAVPLPPWVFEPTVLPALPPVASPPPPVRAAKPTCDGVQVVLRGGEATGGTSITRLRACVGAACESFRIDPVSLSCVPVASPGRITCFNDEGKLRLFLHDGLAATLRIVAEGGAGRVLVGHAAAEGRAVCSEGLPEREMRRREPRP
jgi:hypothetical protein